MMSRLINAIEPEELVGKTIAHVVEDDRMLLLFTTEGDTCVMAVYGDDEDAYVCSMAYHPILSLMEYIEKGDYPKLIEIGALKQSDLDEFEAHERTVKEAIAAERLLQYEALKKEVEGKGM